MASDDRYNILIVDSDSLSRGKLKQVALALTSFNKVTAVASLAEGLSKTETPEQIDIVVISNRFGEEDLSRFVQEAKKTRRGKEWAYMLVLQSVEQQNQVIAGGVLNGIDGFLFEPYSAENMREMAEITAHVKLRNEASRKKAAMAMILKEILGHLDAVAFFRSCRRESAVATRKFRESCAALKSMKDENYEAYVETAIEIFGSANLPASKAYSGVSQRVREKLEAKDIEDLERRYRSL